MRQVPTVSRSSQLFCQCDSYRRAAIQSVIRQCDSYRRVVIQSVICQCHSYRRAAIQSVICQCNSYRRPFRQSIICQHNNYRRSVNLAEFDSYRRLVSRPISLISHLPVQKLPTVGQWALDESDSYRCFIIKLILCQRNCYQRPFSQPVPSAARLSHSARADYTTFGSCCAGKWLTY